MIIDSKSNWKAARLWRHATDRTHFFNGIADSQDITGYAIKQPGNLR